jgi:hypothetical protein
MREGGTIDREIDADNYKWSERILAPAQDYEKDERCRNEGQD